MKRTNAIKPLQGPQFVRFVLSIFTLRPGYGNTLSLSSSSSSSSFKLTVPRHRHHVRQLHRSRTKSCSSMAGQRGQCLADDCCDSCGSAICTRSHDLLCRHRQVEMGHQQCLHGLLRLCLCPHVLGDLGLQNRFRSTHDSRSRWHTRPRSLNGI